MELSVSANSRGTARSAPSSSCAACAVYGFWNFYVTEAEAELALKQTHLTALSTDITKGVATARRLREFQAEVTKLEASAREPAATCCPSRRTSPTPCAACRGSPTQSNLTLVRFTPAPQKQLPLYAEVPYRITAAGHVPQPRPVLRSREQVPANHQRRRHLDHREPAAGPEQHRRRRLHRDDLRAAGSAAAGEGAARRPPA